MGSGRTVARFDRILHESVNQGKAAALRDGFAAASGETVLVQDADLEYDPRDYGKLLTPILAGGADPGQGCTGGRRSRF